MAILGYNHKSFKMMNDKVILIEMLFEKIEHYSKTTFELYKLKTIDKTTDIFASVASRFAIAVILALFFILITIGLALYLGEILGKNYYGFFTLAGFYAIIAIILIATRKKWLEHKLNDYLINQIFKEKKDANY